MSAVWTLEDALTHGRGVERPIRCPSPEHDDTHASASVNVVKGVWYCFACTASGAVDGKRVPSTEELAEMLRPEESIRVFHPKWLELFGAGGYWLERFPMWVCATFGFGEDPFTGDGTFPVHTARGQLAGVGRRQQTVDKGSRYRYPRNWSAATTLWTGRGYLEPAYVVVLTEGAADAASLWEVGAPAYACYGAGLHHPQYDLLARLAPKLVLLGYDSDKQGDKAAWRDLARLTDYTVARVNWAAHGAKDPAELRPEQRTAALLEAVSESAYRPAQDPEVEWRQRCAHLRSTYEASREE